MSPVGEEEANLTAIGASNGIRLLGPPAHLPLG